MNKINLIKIIAVTVLVLIGQQVALASNKSQTEPVIAINDNKEFGVNKELHENLNNLARTYFYTGACQAILEEEEARDNVVIFDSELNTQLELTPTALNILKKIYNGEIISMDEVIYHLSINTQNLSSRETVYILDKLSKTITADKK
jgi:hypothetical protein